jgi:hypothetical protein
MRPITNALTAIGCGVTKTEPQAPRTARAAAPVQQQPAAAVSPDTTTPVRRGPNRARIAALASQHQPGVVRGDTAAQYMVMLLDAAENYLWSTYGSGSLFIEIGGDTRTAAERVAYMDLHRAEYQGKAMKPAAEISLNPKIGKLYFHYDSALHSSAFRPRTRGIPDSMVKAYFDTLNFRFTRGYVTSTDSARGGARGGGGGAGGRGGGGARGGGGGVIADSLVTKFFTRRELMLDSLPMYHFTRGSDAIAPNGVSRVNAPDGSYRIGWGSVNASPSERATGLVSAGNGQSGIEGLPSTWISMGESYVFAPGELAPQMLRIVVVHLTPGTTWKGR